MTKAATGVSAEGESSEQLRSLWGRYDMLHLPYRLLMVAKMLDRATSAAVDRDAGLSLPQWRVLANLERLEPCSAALLAEASQVDRAEISRAVAGLEKDGLLQRQDHPSSRVMKQLSLTPAGRAVARRIGVDRHRFYSFLLDSLDDGERAQFDSLLLRLAQRIEVYEHKAQLPQDAARAAEQLNTPETTL